MPNQSFASASPEEQVGAVSSLRGETSQTPALSANTFQAVTLIMSTRSESAPNKTCAVATSAALPTRCPRPENRLSAMPISQPRSVILLSGCFGRAFRRVNQRAKRNSCQDQNGDQPMRHLKTDLRGCYRIRRRGFHRS